MEVFIKYTTYRNNKEVDINIIADYILDRELFEHNGDNVYNYAKVENIVATLKGKDFKLDYIDLIQVEEYLLEIGWDKYIALYQCGKEVY